MALTLKQQRFVDAYIAHNGNASEAARIAGYKVPGQEGYRLLKSAEIAAAIAERTAEAAKASKGKILSAEDVLTLLSEQATADMDDMLDPYGNPNVDMARMRGKTRLIRKVKPTKDGVEIELLDPQKAQELLGKYHGLWSDQAVVNVHAGTAASDLLAAVTDALNDHVSDPDQRKAITAAILDRLAGGHTPGAD